jgi:predicted Zn-dependent protease
MNYYSSVGREEEAVRAGARAYALFKGDPHVFEEYGQALRRQRRCGEALPVLADGVERFPDRTVLRARLIECALAMGDTARARAVAADGVRRGRTEFENTLRRLEPRIPGLRP